MANGPKHCSDVHDNTFFLFLGQFWTKMSWKKSLLYYISSSLWKKLSWKRVLLVIFKILRLFVNSLTADDNYSLLNTGNLAQPAQIEYAKKQKLSREFFLHFWHQDQFLNISKKHDSHSLCISEFTDCKTRCYINV